MKFKLVSALLVALVFLSIPLAAAPDDKAAAPVVIALNNWTSQRVLSRVIGSVIEQSDIEVLYQEIMTKDQWGALSKGVVDFQVEVWQDTMSGEVTSFINRGLILDLGNYQATGREEWWYPEYVEDMCPGLPQWQALLDCYAIFSLRESQGKGVFYAGPWGNHYGPRIRALALRFIIKRLDDENAIWQLLQQAGSQMRPVLIYNWSPNWIDSRLKGKFIEFPPYHENCHTQAAWGINPSMLADCGGPVSGWIKKVASKRLKQAYPCLYLVLGKVDFSMQMMADASAFVVVDKLSEQEAALKWKDKYARQWQSWLKVKCPRE